MKKLPALLNTPARAVTAVGLIVLLSEYLIMALFKVIHGAFPTMDDYQLVMVFNYLDPILLIAIVSPALYILIFRPMRNQQDELEVAHRKIEQAHREWMDALDVVNDPIFLHDKQFRILRCNKAYQQCAGIPLHEIIGQPYYTIYPKNHGPLPSCRRAMEKAEEEEEEEEEVTVGGAIYRSRAFYIKDEQGVYLYSVHTLEDITERKQAAEELRLRAQLLDSTLDSIFMHDFEGNFVYINEAGWKTRGYTRDELMGMNLHVLDTPEYEMLIEPQTRELMEDGQSIFESAHRRKDGSVMPIEVSARIIESGGRKLILTTVRDITERKQIETAQKFLAEGSYEHKNENFFQALAKFLAQTLEMDYVCIDRLEGDQLSAQTVAIYSDGEFEDNVSYTLKDTPCGDVVAKKVCCFTHGVRHLFPKDAVLQEMLAESYVGTTLFRFDGKPIGLIAVIGRQPLANPRLAESLLQMVSARTSGELERQHAEAKLAEQLDELRGWHDVMMGREMRVIELKHEVDELLAQAGQPPRYPNAEYDGQQEK